MPQTIPPAIEQQAITTITAMTERGLKEPRKIQATCRSIAVVLLSKWDTADKRMIRMLTNLMISTSIDVTEKMDR